MVRSKKIHILIKKIIDKQLVKIIQRLGKGADMLAVCSI
jgi:hypothetical protein